jgi:glycosyltransferase involved in cell wall biosynthesis
MATKATGQTVHVLTNKRSADASMGRLTEAYGERVQFHAVGMPPGFGWLERPRLGFLARVEYMIWCGRAALYLRNVGTTLGLGLAHHATFATEMLPTPMSSLPKSVYRTWGPIGSAGDRKVFALEPQSRVMKAEGFKQQLRDGASRVCLALFGRGVDLFITQTRELSHQLAVSGRSSQIFPNLILDVDITSTLKRSRIGPKSEEAGGARILGVGHLIPRKRFDIAIRLLAEPDMKDATLTLAGSEPGGGHEYHLALARSLGVQDRVVFLGKVSRENVMLAMTDSDVLFHPSGREGAPGVIGEAISIGLPVICFGGTGAAELVNSVVGSGLVLNAREATYEHISRAISEGRKMHRDASNIWTMERFENFYKSLLLERHGPSQSAPR